MKTLRIAPRRTPLRALLACAALAAASQLTAPAQTPGCDYQVSPNFIAPFPASGGQGSFQIVTGAGCEWKVASTAPWITVTQGSGTGPGTAAFTVAPNYGRSRSTQLFRTDHAFFPISQEAAPLGEVVVSEFRLDGPAGPADEFVELHNRTDAPVTVQTSDGSGGWAVVVWLLPAQGQPLAHNFCTIPAGTVLPARSHFLCANSFTEGGQERGYSLKDYGGPNLAAGDIVTAGPGVSADGEATRFLGLTLFRTSDPANFTFPNRVDAVHLTLTTQDLAGSDSAGATYGAELRSAQQFSWLRRDGNGRARTADDVSFLLVAPQGGIFGAGRLAAAGAPGPQNLSSPLRRNDSIKASLVAPRLPPSKPPNFAADPAPVPNGNHGTVSVRRQFTNRTGANVTRLRFRIVDLSTLNTGDIAVLYAVSSPDVTVGAKAGGQQIAVRGTTLEEPPAQPVGGGINSTLSVGSITPDAPLPPGESVVVQFVFAVDRRGPFRFIINVEALP